VKLTRADVYNAAWSPSAVEGQIAVHLPTACLSRLSLAAFFRSIPIKSCDVVVETRLESRRNKHTVLDFLSLLDSTFSSLLTQSLALAAPCIFSPGYLEVRQSVEPQVSGSISDNLKSKSLWHSTQQIPSISESFSHVQRITRSVNLKEKISSLVLRYTFYPMVSMLTTLRLPMIPGEWGQLYGDLPGAECIILAGEFKLPAS